MAAFTAHSRVLGGVCCHQQQQLAAPRVSICAHRHATTQYVPQAALQQASSRQGVLSVQLPSLKPSRRSAVVAHAAAAYPFKKKDARLVLEDGSVWQGTAFGATGTEVGEVVFNTSITGYQEIMTDPSYKGQFVCFTHPHIGNVGVNDADEESEKCHLGAIIVRDVSIVVSNYRSVMSLDEYCKKHNVLGLCNLDTRALTKVLRETGCLNGVICTDASKSDEELVAMTKNWTIVGKDLLSVVSCKEPYEWKDPTGEEWEFNEGAKTAAGGKAFKFSVLGVGCAGAAVLLYEGVRVSEVVLRPLPRWVSAPLGGAVCGLIAFKFPQVQYGYINLEEIFRDSTRLSAVDLSSLLLAKIAATSVCVGGGLVGGLFAPSLFIGALVGDVMGHFVANRWGVADPTTLVVVGAAAVLGAACRAPLTAFGLMVEITRDTGLFVPLLASIGVASLVSEYAEGIFSEKLEAALSGIYLKEKLLFWGAGSDSPSPAMAAAAAAGSSPAAGESAGTALSSRAGSPGLGAGVVAMAVKQQQQQKTVEAVIATPARLYVRHTLPLEQAKDALIARASQAAVVVDDSFTPLGIVYLDDIEAELVKQELLAEPDANFDRPAR